jgi:O-antigen/teichoic acid export membrane protein
MRLIRKLFGNNYTKAGGLYLFGNLFDKAIIFLTIPIFTRILSTSDFGIVNVYLSAVSVLSLIVGLSLGSSIRNAFIDFEEDFDGYISSIFFLSFMNFIVTSAVIIIISYFFVPQLDMFLVILCLIQSFMTFIVNSISIKYMMAVEYVKRSILLAIPNIVITILSIICIVNIESSKYMGRIIPYVVVMMVIGSFYLYKIFRQGKMLLHKKYYKYAIALSLPLIFHGLSINVLSIADRSMILMYRSAAESGVYSLVYSLSMVATVVTLSIESIWIPWFTNRMQSGEKETINSYVVIYIEFVLVIMIAIMMLGPEVLIIMAPREFWIGKVLIPPIVMAAFFIFLYSISVNLEYYYKSTKTIAVNTALAAIVSIGLNIIFIPLYGGTAAAYSTVAAYMLSFVVHYRAARKLDCDLFPIRIYIKPIVILLLAVVTSYFIIDIPYLRWSIVIVGFGLYILISIKTSRFIDFLR